MRLFWLGKTWQHAAEADAVGWVVGAFLSSQLRKSFSGSYHDPLRATRFFPLGGSCPSLRFGSAFYPAYAVGFNTPPSTRWHPGLIIEIEAVTSKESRSFRYLNLGRRQRAVPVPSHVEHGGALMGGVEIPMLRMYTSSVG